MTFDRKTLCRIADDATLPPFIRLGALDRIPPKRWPSVLAYLASLVAVNLAYLQPWTWVTFPVVGAWSAGSILVGGVFVARDYAQRRVGHWVGAAMVVGIGITAWMSAELAVASGAAFAVSEGLEWAIFTVTKRPFRERVVISAVPSVVLDSLVFLALAPFPFSFALFLAQVASKLVAILVFIPATAPRSAQKEALDV